jgi:hypothetical protein
MTTTPTPEAIPASIHLDDEGVAELRDAEGHTYRCLTIRREGESFLSESIVRTRVADELGALYFPKVTVFLRPLWSGFLNQ